MTDQQAKSRTLFTLDCTSVKKGLNLDWRFSKKRLGDYVHWNGPVPDPMLRYANTIVNPAYYTTVRFMP
jgi:hypothetical protein